jgi:general secretion pathway protein A
MDPNFFGMTEHPFAPTPDPRFYYKSAAHQTALAALSHAIEESGGPLALMAGAGVGKTTFLLRLAERLRGIPGITLAIQSYPGAQEFLRNLVVNLGVKPSGRDWVELHRQVSVLLAHESLAGKHVLVAIDDAHKLDELALEAVQTVSRSAAEGRNSVQFLLVGQNELATNLARPFLRDLHQRLSTITRIPVLSETETGL